MGVWCASLCPSRPARHPLFLLCISLCLLVRIKQPQRGEITADLKNNNKKKNHVPYLATIPILSLFLCLWQEALISYWQMSGVQRSKLVAEFKWRPPPCFMQMTPYKMCLAVAFPCRKIALTAASTTRRFGLNHIKTPSAGLSTNMLQARVLGLIQTGGISWNAPVLQNQSQINFRSRNHGESEPLPSTHNALLPTVSVRRVVPHLRSWHWRRCPHRSRSCWPPWQLPLRNGCRDWNRGRKRC